MLKQISIFVENRKGRLALVTQVLGEAGIDLIALSVADTTEYGIVRCIADQPEKAVELLLENGFTAATTEVLAVEVPDEPGGLAKVLQIVEDADINVEYLYSFVRTVSENALILLRVENNKNAACIKALQANGVRVLSDEEVYHSKKG